MNYAFHASQRIYTSDRCLAVWAAEMKCAVIDTDIANSPNVHEVGCGKECLRHQHSTAGYR